MSCKCTKDEKMFQLQMCRAMDVQSLEGGIYEKEKKIQRCKDKIRSLEKAIKGYEKRIIKAKQNKCYHHCNLFKATDVSTYRYYDSSIIELAKKVYGEKAVNKVCEETEKEKQAIACAREMLSIKD